MGSGHAIHARAAVTHSLLGCRAFFFSVRVCHPRPCLLVLIQECQLRLDVPDQRPPALPQRHQVLRLACARAAAGRDGGHRGGCASTEPGGEGKATQLAAASI